MGFKMVILQIRGVQNMCLALCDPCVTGRTRHKKPSKAVPQIIRREPLAVATEKQLLTPKVKKSSKACRTGSLVSQYDHASSPRRRSNCDALELLVARVTVKSSVSRTFCCQYAQSCTSDEKRHKHHTSAPPPLNAKSCTHWAKAEAGDVVSTLKGV